MAFTEFYCDPQNGSNLSAGSTNSAPTFTSAAGNWDGTSVFTPTDGSTPSSTVSAGMFASVYVTAGATVATYIARITAVGSGTNGTITLSTTAKAGAAPSSGSGTLSIVVGGYWQGPHGSTAFPFGFVTSTLTDSSGDYPRVSFKNSATFSITAAMTHNIAGPVYFQGMTSSPGDRGRATIDGGTSGASYALLTVSAANNFLRDLIFQNNGATGSANGVVFNAASTTERVTVNNVLGYGLNFGSGGQVIECEAYACNKSNSTAGGFRFGSAGSMVRCIAHHNTGSNNSGIVLGASGCVLTECVIAANQAGISVTAASSLALIEECTLYGNAGDGIKVAVNTCVVTIENSLLTSNGGYGVNNSGTSNVIRLSNNAYYSNTTAPTNGATDETGAITLTAAAMSDPTNGDFSLNRTAGAGAAVRNAGRGAFTQAASQYTKTTTAYPDGGAVQHNDTGGAVQNPIVIGG